MKKSAAFLLAIIMLLSSCPIAVDAFFEDDYFWSDEYYSEDFMYKIRKDGTARIEQYNGNASSLIIPDELDGHTVTAIFSPGFRDKTNLKSVKIPDSVTDINWYAFINTGIWNDMKNWDRNAVLYVDNCLIRVRESVDDLPDGHREIVLGDYKIKENTRLIASSAFSSDAYSGGIYGIIESITVPASAKCFGLEHINKLEDLKNVYIDSNNPYYTNGEYGEVYNKDKTELLFIPKSTLEDKIEKFVIPEGVTSVSQYFVSSRIENLVIPASVKEIKSWLTSDYYSNRWWMSLKSITVDDNNAYYFSDEHGVLYNKEKTELICYPAELKLSSYYVPDGVQTIKKGAFYGVALDELMLPASVKTVEFVFDEGNNGRINELFLKKEIEHFDKTNLSCGFDFCSSLHSVYYEGSESEWNSLIQPDEYGYYVPLDMHYDYPGRAKFDEHDDTVLIPQGMGIRELCSQLGENNAEVYDKDNNLLADDALVGTGSIIRVKDNDGDVILEYTVVLPGDVDGNGKVQVSDARTVLRCSALIDFVDGPYYAAADVDKNGKTTASDARRVLRIAAKLEKIRVQ